MPGLKRGLLTLSLSLLTMVGAHLYITDRKFLLQLAQPIEAIASYASISCSEGAPEWMKRTLRDSLTFSLGGQIAFIAPQGASHQCTHGWQGVSMFSKRIGPDTIFRLASLTKIVTSMAYATLSNAGSLNNNDLLFQSLLPNGVPADPRLAQVRIDHLHQHTAGFNRYRTADPMTRFKHRPWCPWDLAQLANIRLDFTPGEQAAYSNLSYCLLGQVVAKAYGRSYRVAANELLGLDEYNLEFTDGPYLAEEPEYDFRNSGFYGANYYQYFDFEANSATFGLVGSASSFSRFVYEHASLLEPAFQESLKSSLCDPEALRSCYYYSMQPVKRNDGLFALLHPGYLWGSSSLLFIDEHGGVTVWVGKGSPRKMKDFDSLTWDLYDKLEQYYRFNASQEPQGQGSHRVGRGHHQGSGVITRGQVSHFNIQSSPGVRSHISTSKAAQSGEPRD